MIIHPPNQTINMSDRRAELEKKKQKLQQLRELKEMRRQEKENRDRVIMPDLGLTGSNNSTTLSGLRSGHSSLTSSSLGGLANSMTASGDSTIRSDINEVDDILESVGITTRGK